jgi:auxin-responsive protein IAA
MAPPQERDYIGLSLAAAAATELRLGLPGTEDAAPDGDGATAGSPLTLELLSKGGAKRGFAGAAGGKAVAEEEDDEKKKAQAPAAK